MDPITNLTEQINLARSIQTEWDKDNEVPDLEEIANDAAQLAELVLALDKWMRGGGFSPWKVTA